MKKELKTAIEKSIKHWEKDILSPLKKGRVIEGDEWKDTGIEVKFYAKHCALCQYCITKHIKLRTRYGFICDVCPLEKACGDVGSPYYKFRIKPTLKNAQAMVDALKNLLKEKK
jgi:hypothetical protein